MQWLAAYCTLSSPTVWQYFFMRPNLLCGTWVCGSWVCGSGSEQRESYVLFLDTIVFALTVLRAKRTVFLLISWRWNVFKVLVFLLDCSGVQKGLVLSLFWRVWLNSSSTLFICSLSHINIQPTLAPAALHTSPLPSCSAEQAAVFTAGFDPMQNSLVVTHSTISYQSLTRELSASFAKCSTKVGFVNLLLRMFL